MTKHTVCNSFWAKITILMYKRSKKSVAVAYLKLYNYFRNKHGG